jgi:hypothetical protein
MGAMHFWRSIHFNTPFTARSAVSRLSETGCMLRAINCWDVHFRVCLARDI